VIDGRVPHVIDGSAPHEGGDNVTHSRQALPTEIASWIRMFVPNRMRSLKYENLRIKKEW